MDDVQIIDLVYCVYNLINIRVFNFFKISCFTIILLSYIWEYIYFLHISVQ
jgi:hypothetical protein